MKKLAYLQTLLKKYEELRGVEVESVETEWEMFRDIVKECTDEVCGVRRVGGQRNKRSEWWSEEVGVVVAEKRRAFEDGYREEIGIHMIDTGDRKML